MELVRNKRAWDWFAQLRIYVWCFDVAFDLYCKPVSDDRNRLCFPLDSFAIWHFELDPFTHSLFTALGLVVRLQGRPARVWRNESEGVHFVPQALVGSVVPKCLLTNSSAAREGRAHCELVQVWREVELIQQDLLCSAPGDSH